jgi:hypothetical protein
VNVVATRPQLRARLLHRRPVLLRDGGIVELADLLFDDARWVVRYLVIDDLAPMPRRDALVKPALAVSTGEALRVHLTREELKRCPDLDQDRPVYLQHDLHGVPRPADPHLRSVEIILGFGVRAGGKAAGRLKDIEIDPDGWRIGSLIIDSGVWLPGKRRTIEPREVRSIDWIARTIELTRL